MNIKITEKRISKPGRRRFIRNSMFSLILLLSPLSACKHLFKQPGASSYYLLTATESALLMAVYQHLFPNDGKRPTVEELQMGNYFEWIMNDAKLEARNRKLLRNGFGWLIQVSKELYNADFTKLNAESKEVVLRELETYKNGRRWLSKLLSYLMEALLASPVYGGNPNEQGWKWLAHAPGYPQATKQLKYGDYGYGL